MQKLRRLQQEEPAPAGPGPQEPRSASASPVTPGVTFVWGSQCLTLEIQGMTVGDAWRALREPYNVAPGVNALVNGRLADPEHRLSEGELLEFIRPAGEKGASE